MTSDRNIPANPSQGRLLSIDILRGMVILFMLLDHVRETFFLHHQVPDPMVVANTPPDLFFSRILAHLCAPIFVFLTGLSAYLYATKSGEESRQAASSFLWRRGLFLVLLEVTVINFAWTFQFPPAKLFLQVIWIIGLSMLALAALVWLPRRVLIAVGVALVAGHNLLDGVHFAEGHPLHVIWAVLHERTWLVISETMKARTSYPLMPWIGLIALGYAAGPWFRKGSDAAMRQRHLLVAGLGLIAGFFVLRALNIYGDKPWVADESTLLTVMSFFNLTKYPPSLLFCAFNLGIGLLLLRAFERIQGACWLKPVAVFGSVPMFFYILHLYVLKFLYLACSALWGSNQGELFGFDSMPAVWACWIALPFALYPIVRAFANFKARRRDIAWLKYL
ncbi:DUF1624 domain-containing protein [Propionivibrio limicola]|uniref:DUF1624 domain-containing protein n=1 Tax=Propionivibrio limicola TaxID=167645 RepID=UPI001292B6E8|nr:DUF1624 domain-containing protein [Propionivibrio limicola]